MDVVPMRGLLITEPWITKILEGRKTWEMRRRPTRVRERIGLIRSGSGFIVGSVELVDCLPELGLSEIARTRRHAVPRSRQAQMVADGVPRHRTSPPATIVFDWGCNRNA